MCECVYFFFWYGLVIIIGSFLTGRDRAIEGGKKIKKRKKKKKEKNSFHSSGDEEE